MSYAPGPLPFLACLAWLFLPAWILMMVGRMIMNEMDTGLGVLAIAAAIFVGATMFSPPTPLAGQFAVVAIWVTAALWIPATRMIERREERASADEAIELAYGALTMNPDNAVAKFRLARFMAERGYIAHADAIARDVLPAMPRAAFREEHRLGASWAAWTGRPTPVRCGGCGGPIPPGAVRCPSCGTAWLIAHAPAGRHPGAASRIIALWGVLIGVSIGLASVPALPAGASAAAAVALLLIGAGAAWWGLRPLAK